MPRTTARPKIDSFNFRVDPELKAAFTAATAEQDKPAGQVLRDFMRGYVDRRRTQSENDEARRQSLVIAAQAAMPGSDESATLDWLERAADTSGWTA